MKIKSDELEKVDSITYVSSDKLNGMMDVSTLTVESTTAYDQSYPLWTMEKFEKKIEGEDTTRKMRKVLKHIYKRPIHSENDEKINKQEVLLKHSDSEKDLLTVTNGRLTDVIKSDVVPMNEAATTVSGNLNKVYNESIEIALSKEHNFISDDNNVFGEEEDMAFKKDHQSDEGM